MLVLEATLEGTKEQYEKLNEAIRTSRFVGNSCLRYWMDNKGCISLWHIHQIES